MDRYVLVGSIKDTFLLQFSWTADVKYISMDGTLNSLHLGCSAQRFYM